MAAEQTIDETKAEEFMGQVIGDYSGALTVNLCYIGDRLGLFKTLADGPASPAELAERAGINERYAAEWLRGLTAAGYMSQDDSSGQYSLSPEQALVLSSEGTPMSFGGGYQMVGGMVGPMEAIVDAFKNGGGAGQDVYPEDVWAGMERFTDGWFENFLLQEWIPGMPSVEAKLKEGGSYADVGCGSGRAVIKLAEAFPESTFAGYDLFPGQAKRAEENVAAAGLSDRVTIGTGDAGDGLPEKYDVISTYDVVHDAADPLGLLKGIRQSLNDDGTYICLDINCADKHEDNEGPLAAMFYGFSVFYCMTTSLANGGEGLGTCGLPEAKARELCEEAGFSELRRVEMDNPFNNLYEVCA